MKLRGTDMMVERRYTRWTRSDVGLAADILGARILIVADPGAGMVHVDLPDPAGRLSPDEARLYGVRLIEAAGLADGERAIRSLRRTG